MYRVQKRLKNIRQLKIISLTDIIIKQLPPKKKKIKYKTKTKIFKIYSECMS